MSEEKVEPPVQVLFVDDEENIIKALRRLFMDEEFEVLTATSGPAGLQIIQDNEHVGLIVSDQRMPGMEGVDFLAEARKLVPDALRIILTGYADINAAMGAINRGGAFRYLTKPWQDDELILNIREAVDLFKLKRENIRLNKVVKEQNEMLEQWNARLKQRVLEQTAEIRRKSEGVMALNVRLKKSFDNTLQSFSNLLEMRNKSAWNHAGKVAALSVQIAKAKGLAEDEVKIIRSAALLHDIGKIGISDKLLVRGDKGLSADEMNEYRLHSVRGQSAIDAIEDLRESGVLIRHHHELFNGKGWPDGLQGENIPLGARIIGIADYLDKKISANPVGDFITYGLSRTKEAVDELFDPELFAKLAKAARQVYASYKPEETMSEKEVDPGELLPGKILARDVLSGTGIFLLGKGHELDEGSIRSIQRYYRLDPPKQGIFIWDWE